MLLEIGWLKKKKKQKQKKKKTRQEIKVVLSLGYPNSYLMGSHGEIYKSHTSVISTNFVDQVQTFFIF